jgi:hypothetical protein
MEACNCTLENVFSYIILAYFMSVEQIKSGKIEVPQWLSEKKR